MLKRKTVILDGDIPLNPPFSVKLPTGSAIINDSKALKEYLNKITVSVNGKMIPLKPAKTVKILNEEVTCDFSKQE